MKFTYTQYDEIIFHLVAMPIQYPVTGKPSSCPLYHVLQLLTLPVYLGWHSGIDHDTKSQKSSIFSVTRIVGSRVSGSG